MTHNKSLNPLISLLINCISAKSVPQILSIKECTFLSLNFLIIGLSNSLANSLLGIFSFLIPLPANLFAHLAEFFYQKIYKPLKQDLIDSIIFWIFSNIKCFIMQYFAVNLRQAKAP